MASDVKVANAIVTVTPSMEGARSKISSDISDAFGGIGDDGGALVGDGFLSGIAGKLGPALGPLLAGIVSTAAVAAVGKALLDIGAQFDDMTDAIIIGTGASGAALEDLEASARAVATSLPVSFGDAGKTVADLNTRLGLTGDELTELATKVSALGTFGENIDINTMTGAFAAFGVQADDVADRLDYFWGVSQATGVSMSQLFSTLQSNAPQLTALGFSMEESANMVGLLDKAGIDASSTMSSMSRALVNLAEPGQSTQEAFAGVIAQLQGFIAAGDEAAALDLAASVFGTRGATKFVAAVQSGALSLDQLSDAALGASGSIMGTMDATMSWPERFEVIKNQLMDAISPLASALFEGLGASMEAVSAAIASVDPDTIRQIGESLGGAVASAVPVIVDFVSGTLPGLLQGAAGFLSVTTQLLTYLPAIAPAFLSILGPVGAVAGGILSITGYLMTLWNTNEEFRAAVMDVWSSITSFFSSIPGTIEGFFSGLPDALFGFFDDARAEVAQVGENIVSFWAGIPDRIIGFFRGIGDFISSLFQDIKLPHFKLLGSINPLDWPSQGLPGIKIDWYATGGIIDSPRVIGAGEAGPEAVVPLSPSRLAPVGAAVVDSLQDSGLAEIVALLQDIRDNGKVIVMDSGELVGATIGATDTGLGSRENWASRGVAYA